MGRAKTRHLYKGQTLLNTLILSLILGSTGALILTTVEYQRSLRANDDEHTLEYARIHGSYVVTSLISESENLLDRLTGVFHSGAVTMSDMGEIAAILGSITREHMPTTAITYGASHGGVVSLWRDPESGVWSITTTNDRHSGPIRTRLLHELSDSSTMAEASLAAVAAVASVDVRTTWWYFYALDRKYVGWGSDDPVFSFHTSTYFVSRPVFDSRNTLVGVLRVDLSIDRLSKLLDQAATDSGATLRIAHKNRIVAASSADALTGPEKTLAKAASPELPAPTTIALSGNDISWELEIEILGQRDFDAIEGKALIYLTIAASILVVCFIAGIALSRGIFRPIELLAKSIALRNENMFATELPLATGLQLQELQHTLHAIEGARLTVGRTAEIADEVAAALTVITGYAEMILYAPELSNVVREDIDRILRSAGRATGLLRAAKTPGEDSSE